MASMTAEEGRGRLQSEENIQMGATPSHEEDLSDPGPVPQKTNLGAGLPIMSGEWSFQWFLSILYAVGIVLFAFVWVFTIGKEQLKAHPIVYIGLGVGIFYMAINFWTAHSERVTTFSEEAAEKETVTQHAFYMTAGLFAFGSLLTALHGKDKIRPVAYLFLLSLLINVAFLFPPIWVSTVQSMPVIVMKHIYTVVFSFSTGFIVSGLCIILSQLRKDSNKEAAQANQSRSSARVGVRPDGKAEKRMWSPPRMMSSSAAGTDPTTQTSSHLGVRVM
jgi:hypothetical protein